MDTTDLGCEVVDGSNTTANGFVQASPLWRATIVGIGNSTISLGSPILSIDFDLGDFTENISLSFSPFIHIFICTSSLPGTVNLKTALISSSVVIDFLSNK